jgi:hypothetical protein
LLPRPSRGGGLVSAEAAAATWAALPRLALLAVLAIMAALLWTAVPRLGNVAWVMDSTEFQRYAQTLDTTGHLPTKATNYEFSIPPGMPALAIGLERAGRWIGPIDLRFAGGLPRPLRAVLWVGLVLGAGWLVLTAGGSRRRRRAGIVLGVCAAVLAALDVVSAATSVAWVPGLLPQIGSVLGLVLVSALLAHEIWPEDRWAPPLAALGASLLPFAFRLGVVFHPDPLFAFFASSAVLVCVRASRRGWTIRAGAATGLLLGLSALIRQSAPVAMVSIALVALILGRRRSLRYFAAGAAVIAIVAGPWWGYQANRYGNPIQSNLGRTSILLDHEPLSFFVDVPTAVVTNPWSLLERNLLFPKFHVGIWSDWTAVAQFGGSSGSNAKALASSQSVLGFGGDLLVLAGLFALGLPAVVRLARGPSADAEQRGLAAVAVFFTVAWIAFLVMILRFPQRDGDPVSPHYLLFLVPPAAALGLAAARRLWLTGGWRRGLVFSWLVLYLTSWIWVLTTLI